jgi:hypothetical protein
MGKAVSNRDYHLSAQAKSGLSVKDYCRRERLNHLTFYKWRSRPGRRTAGSLPFIQVSPSPSDAACVVRFADGTELRVHDGGDGRAISLLVSALRDGLTSRC